MKRTILSAVLSLSIIFGLTFNGLAQQQYDEPYELKNEKELKTLLKPGRKQGFYGAFSSGYAPINNKVGVTVSARGTWLIDRSFGIGFGGTGFINNVEQYWNWTNLPYLPDDMTLTGGYGGIILEPVLLPRMPVHLSFPVLFGVGAANTFNNLYYSYYTIEGVFLVVEPHVELEFNMTRFARFALYGSYRFTSGLHLTDVPKNSLDGYSLGFIVKFGIF